MSSWNWLFLYLLLCSESLPLLTIILEVKIIFSNPQYFCKLKRNCNIHEVYYYCLVSKAFAHNMYTVLIYQRYQCLFMWYKKTTLYHKVNSGALLQMAADLKKQNALSWALWHYFHCLSGKDFEVMCGQ